MNGVSSKNASERKPPIPVKSAGKPLVSKMPMRWSLRSSPPNASIVGAASETPTSCPDMRRPLKVTPLGAQPMASASAALRSVSPIPESITKRDSTEPSTVTGTVTRWCRYSKGGTAATLTPSHGPNGRPVGSGACRRGMSS